MKGVLILALSATLAGCAAAVPPPPATVTVEVPVPVYCEPEVPLAPALPVDALRPGAGLHEVARALWASLELLEGHAERLRAAAESCRGAR